MLSKGLVDLGKRREREWAWPVSRLTRVGSTALVKGREKRVAKQNDLAGGSLVRNYQESGCGPKPKPPRKLVLPR